MSGTFKATTINTEISNLIRPYIFMNSAIKPWKEWEKNLFHELNRPNDLNLGLLHLCRLSDYVRGSLNKDIEIMYVERGISDMMFYWSDLKDSEPNENMVMDAVKQESSICKEGNYVPVKTLLVQKDQKFISEVILREPSRRERFPGGVEQYLEAQDRYVEFTRKYNDISEEIIIDDAKRYITNDLGLTFNINA